MCCGFAVSCHGLSVLLMFGCCPAWLFRDCHRVNEMNLLMITTVWIYTAYFLGNTTIFVPSEGHVNIYTPFDVPLTTGFGSFQGIDSFELFQIRSLICSVTLSAGYIFYSGMSESLNHSGDSLQN